LVGLFTQLPAEFLYEPDVQLAAFARVIELDEPKIISMAARLEIRLVTVLCIYSGYSYLQE
jgi:hypothetical protein